MVQENNGNFSVKEIMNPNVVSLGSDATVKEASELMAAQKIGSIVILDKNEPVGIITERDFATKIMLKPYSADTKVSEVMSSPVVHISSNQSVADVIDIMANKEIRKVPVIDEGKVIGIVTGTEFLRLFVQATDEDMQKAYQQYVKRVYSNWFKD
ncbi:MAG: CBS domain-containing protein [Nitrosopumilaceae archaeon]|jgi:CBS domain-containing protein|uniref:CBS domain-containing protein n=3 Tax=Candidatus Nitrosomaritimum aestuariumsis TaxID=3342354 RepID=A0AC60VYL0_9ARCH|nr:CBS domain-containing protein [Nitrosopumilaceae archaeon]MBA4454218.1 CBS domain-containing protein [Nitrosopumilaceae archaeon]MBA4460157.1 CBS domain-containing protein [Nitrosopumilaceae archaeon]MBA4461665.1 CBS domain-containing protein [Nitrosopumilaceae archaeon]MBA4463399.1 CBS domain-containing protein [Nitrosopumilaceae archaeon]